MPAGPRPIGLYWPIVRAWRELLARLAPERSFDLVVESLDIPGEERAERAQERASRVDNQVHWARSYLVWAGLLDGSKRGWWQLTTSGWSLDLEDHDLESAYEPFKRVHGEHAGVGGQVVADDSADPEQPRRAGQP